MGDPSAEKIAKQIARLENRAEACRLTHNNTMAEEFEGYADTLRLLAAKPEFPMAALRAIAGGYPIRLSGDRYIFVENPEFKPDNGQDPLLCIDVDLLAGLTDEEDE